ncbi:MAG TPA: hypothetical protein VFV60_05575, partial [bacterium]|nr:hypothetical protein [bacterium]
MQWAIVLVATALVLILMFGEARTPHAPEASYPQPPATIVIVQATTSSGGVNIATGRSNFRAVAAGSIA